MTHPWYATTPTVLTDANHHAALTAAARARGPVTASALATRLEAAVASSPQAAFTLDAEGAAALTVAGRTYAAGRFTTPTIGELRATLRTPGAASAPRTRLSVLAGEHALTDIATLQATAPEGVLFQVASQFNCLEAPSSRIVPVRAYVSDPTQGPRASISALPGTLLRHYFAPSPGGPFVQTDARCLDLLGDVLDPTIAEVRSGYLSTSSVRDLPAAAAALAAGFERIRVGVHDGVEVVLGHAWDGAVAEPAPRIAQVFTSTMALGGYGRDDGSPALAEARRQLLRAAYVGTLLAAAALGKHTVVLTLIGGGVFANPHAAIWEAIRFALGELDACATAPIHVVVNSRADLPDEARDEARRRGGFVARVGAEGVVIDG